MNHTNHESKKAIVMGATSGIGYEVARVLAQRGWTVGVAGRRTEVLRQLAERTPGIVATATIDVNRAEAPRQLRQLISEMGGVDLYFHSSGIGYQNPDLDEQKELATIETNCLGMSRMVGEAFRYFASRPEQRAQIAVISSIAGTKGLGAAPAYSASKRFTTHYLESLSQLVSIRRLHHIRISDIRPGFVRTPLIEGSHFPYQLDAGSVAVAIVKAVERGQAIITVNGVYRLLVCLWRLVPRWLWVRMSIR